MSKPNYLSIDAYVRYQEDAYVNGIQDEPHPAPSRMPGMDGDRWRIVIDLELCRVAYWPEGTVAKIHYKVCDEGAYELWDAEGRVIERHCGYVPRRVCPDGLGDYIMVIVNERGSVSDYDSSGAAHPWTPGMFGAGLFGGPQ